MSATDSDPIVAIATAAGRGGIGVVRISAGRAGAAATDALMRALTGQTLAARHAHYVPFIDGENGVLDRGIALYFSAPHSYTGEHVLELQGHGGPVVLQLLLQRCVEAGRAFGLRLAEPGEFTRRAFLNDKLDLAQAEAVADLIEASTEAATRSASRALDGAFSRAVHALVDDVIALRTLVEATLDFPEEETDFLEAANARGQLARIRTKLAHALAEAHQGALLRDGLTVVLAGQPNVGKSSLLNALAGAELAIVTPVAGTTRDRITQTIQIEGVALHVTDTAGLRHAQDEVEQIGIARAWHEIGRADVVLHLLDARTGLSAEDKAIAARFPAGVPVLRVLNKIDLTHQADQPLPSNLPPSIAQSEKAKSRPMVSGDSPQSTTTAKHEKAESTQEIPGNPNPPAPQHGPKTRDTPNNEPDREPGNEPDEVRLSAKNGDGIATLRAALLRLAGWQTGMQGVCLARERHLIALRAADAHLAQAAACAQQNADALDLFAEELRLAQDALGSITGEFSSDDLLGEIFGRFCIGK